MGELGRDGGPVDRDPEGEGPAGRPDPPRRPDELAEPYSIDRRKTTPVQRDFHRFGADQVAEVDGGIPFSIDWKTGKSADDRVRPPDSVPDDGPGDARGVHDPIDETRPYDRWGGLSHPDRRDQWSLEHVAPRDEDGKPEKYPSLDGEWTEYVNDGGPEADPQRGNNCLDCSLAAIATYHGEPTVAAPRTLDLNRQGTPDIHAGETDGVRRAADWLEAKHSKMGSGDEGLAGVEEKLREAGAGSSAAIITAWQSPAGASHAWNAFNDGGKIVWYDPQVSVKGAQPLYGGSQVAKVWAICIDREGKQL